MSSKGNGTRPSYKAQQKNVCVYLGKRDDWMAEVLGLVLKIMDKSESQFFRNLYLERLQSWGVVDKTTGEPDPDAIERLRQKVENAQLLPDILDK